MVTLDRLSILSHSAFHTVRILVPLGLLTAVIFSLFAVRETVRLPSPSPYLALLPTCVALYVFPWIFMYIWDRASRGAHVRVALNYARTPLTKEGMLPALSSGLVAVGSVFMEIALYFMVGIHRDMGYRFTFFEQFSAPSHWAMILPIFFPKDVPTPIVMLSKGIDLVVACLVIYGILVLLLSVVIHVILMPLKLRGFSQFSGILAGIAALVTWTTLVRALYYSIIYGSLLHAFEINALLQSLLPAMVSMTWIAAELWGDLSDIHPAALSRSLAFATLFTLLAPWPQMIFLHRHRLSFALLTLWGVTLPVSMGERLWWRSAQLGWKRQQWLSLLYRLVVAAGCVSLMVYVVIIYPKNQSEGCMGHSLIDNQAALQGKLQLQRTCPFMPLVSTGIWDYENHYQGLWYLAPSEQVPFASLARQDHLGGSAIYVGCAHPWLGIGRDLLAGVPPRVTERITRHLAETASADGPPQTDIAVMLLDSLSLAHFSRVMHKTMAYLRDQTQRRREHQPVRWRVLHFPFMHVHGHNSQANQVPLFSGSHRDQRSSDNIPANKNDPFLLWNYFREHRGKNTITAHVEQELGGKMQRWSGYADPQNTTLDVLFTAPFAEPGWNPYRDHVLTGNQKCLLGTHSIDYNLNMLDMIWSQSVGFGPKWYSSVSFEGHERTVKTIESVDPILANWLEHGIPNSGNTILILMSDHGQSYGRLDETIKFPGTEIHEYDYPTMFVLMGADVPVEIEQKLNANRLKQFTLLDLHYTLQDLIRYPDLPPNGPELHSPLLPHTALPISLLRDDLPVSRTCEEAMIERYCHGTWLRHQRKEAQCDHSPLGQELDGPCPNYPYPYVSDFLDSKWAAHSTPEAAFPAGYKP